MPPPPTLSSVFGSGLIGIVLAASLFGVYCSQMYSYFNYYSGDKIWTKLLVTGIWVVLALQYSFSLHAIYTYLITDFDQDSKLGFASWDWTIYVLLTSIISFAVQLFFARRLFHILHNRIFKWVSLIVITTLSTIGFIFGAYIMSKNAKPILFSRFAVYTWAVDLWLGSNVACDICISSCMVYALYTSRTGVKLADRLINKFMMYSIQSGAVTGFIEILCLASYSASGFHFGHVLVVFPLSSLYAISLMANLHARVPSTPGLAGEEHFGHLDTYGEVTNSDMYEMASSPASEIPRFPHFHGISKEKILTAASVNDPTRALRRSSLNDEDLLVRPPAVHQGRDTAGLIV